MVIWSLLRWKTKFTSAVPPLLRLRSFRSDAALEAIAKASEDKVSNLVLYNYPSFSGAFSALFARQFHSALNLPCLILPFSSVEPLRSFLSLFLASQTDFVLNYLIDRFDFEI